jgi:hypothetical protein
VLYLQLIIFSVGGDVHIDSEALLVIDFVNFKIKLAQFFECVHRGRMCVYVFIRISAHICMNICVLYCVFKKTSATKSYHYRPGSFGTRELKR